MKRIGIQFIRGLVVAAIAVSGLSCVHGNAEKKDIAITPGEHEEIMKNYRKGIEDSKKIVVARVNGVEITLDRLLNRMNQIAPDYIPPGHQRTPEIDQTVKREALDILVFRELAVQEAVRQGMAASPDEFKQFIQKLKDNIGSEDEYHEYLRKINLTEESIKKEFEKNQLFDMIAGKEIYHKVKDNRNEAIEKRKQEWEADLKKNATIEILLDEVGRKMKTEAEKTKEGLKEETTDKTGNEGDSGKDR